ncbi:PREDICTED: protein N-terminal glutamine amidohydrolase isoform X3 [Rhagoletis zephyria]|uniref:protein N-terminal glutamine amidohydrolase isoform X3 n=1 Tax=Rhagoletis zephyria TaxID=28612 RepID=UPI0008117C0A|nr:PREDICTED: protein N-terminal glutamine amidohydrolase isoform X3 [Rhagoletis zephyria]
MTTDLLFPKISDCSYVSCYCEENVWKLCEQVKKTRIDELSKCYAVFVSNEGRTVPLWRQKAGRGDDQVVIWDYHVFFMHNPTPNRCLVFDLDTTLPFPTYFHKYFRVIPAETYLSEFSSDRRHMRRPDGSWIKPPPSYPPIQSSSKAYAFRHIHSFEHWHSIKLLLNFNAFYLRRVSSNSLNIVHSHTFFFLSYLPL